jgi:hypothetical protein
VFIQKQTEIENELAKLDKLNDMRTEISGLRHYEREINNQDIIGQDFTEKLKDSGNDGYTYSQYKELQKSLSGLKQEQKDIENTYEEQRKARDEIQEEITTLQFEANGLCEKRLKITQTNASLVESVKVMKSMESDISTMRVDITTREQSLLNIQNELAELTLNKKNTMTELNQRKSIVDKSWAIIQEPYLECGHLLKSIQTDKINEDEIKIVEVHITDISKQEFDTIKQITKLEGQLEDIKKAILEISGGDRRVDLLRKGKQIFEEIKKIKESLKKKCKHEDEIKEVKHRKINLTTDLEKLKDVYNQTCGYNIRLADDLRSTQLELSNTRYKDITRKLADIEIKHSLAKLMAQEVAE